MDTEALWSNPLIPFSVILILSLIIPEVLKRFRITAVPFYILAGIVLGPVGLGMHVGEGLVFLGDIGLLLLIFLAGLEIHEMGRVRASSIIIFVASISIVSFLGGLAIGLVLGLAVLAACLIGTLMVSSSVGEILPMVNSIPYVKQRLGQVIIPGIVLIDMISIIMLGIIVKVEGSLFSVLLFVAELFLLMAFVFLILPKVLERFFRRSDRKPKEGDFKFIITILMVTVALGYLIGLHGIVSAFIAGIIIGRHIPNESVHNKLHGIGHGMLIPVFFIVLGMQLEIGIVFEGTRNLLLPVVLIVTLVTLKLLGGSISARLMGMSRKDGVLLGIVLWPQLSATIAATKIGYDAGLFEQDILVSVVIMSLVTVLLSPFVLKFASGRERSDRHVPKDHVIVAGYGRTTSKVVYILERMEVPLVVIDQKHGRLKRLSDEGLHTIFGNAASTRTLKEANVMQGRIAILSLSDEHDMIVTARRIKKLNPACHVIAIVHTERSLKDLRDEGLVDDYIWPEKRTAQRITEMTIGRYTGTDAPHRKRLLRQ